MIQNPCLRGNDTIYLKDGGFFMRAPSGDVHDISKYNPTGCHNLSVTGNFTTVVGVYDGVGGCWRKVGTKWSMMRPPEKQWCISGSHEFFVRGGLVMVDNQHAINPGGEVTRISACGEGSVVICVNRSDRPIAFVYSAILGEITGHIEIDLPVKPKDVFVHDQELLTVDSGKIEKIVEWRVDTRSRRRIEFKSHIIAKPPAVKPPAMLTGTGTASIPVSIKRMEACNACRLKDGSKCGLGAGTLQQLQYDMNRECPANRWGRTLEKVTTVIVKNTKKLAYCLAGLREAGFPHSDPVIITRGRPGAGEIGVPADMTNLQIAAAVAKNRGGYVLLIDSNMRLCVDAARKCEWLLQQLPSPGTAILSLYTGSDDAIDRMPHGWHSSPVAAEKCLLAGPAALDKPTAMRWMHTPSLAADGDPTSTRESPWTLSRMAYGAIASKIADDSLTDEFRVGIIVRCLGFNGDSETIRQMCKWWNISGVAVEVPSSADHEMARQIKAPILVGPGARNLDKYLVFEQWQMAVNRIYSTSDIVIRFSPSFHSTPLHGVPTFTVVSSLHDLQRVPGDILVSRRSDLYFDGECRIILPGADISRLPTARNPVRPTVYGDHDTVIHLTEPTTVVGDAESLPAMSDFGYVVPPTYNIAGILEGASKLLTDDSRVSFRVCEALLAGVPVDGCPYPPDALTEAAHRRRWEGLICEIPDIAAKIDQPRETKDVEPVSLG